MKNAPIPLTHFWPFQLRRSIPDCPPCPPKRLLGGHSPEFLEQRRLELVDWVRCRWLTIDRRCVSPRTLPSQVRVLARDERVCRSLEFHEFLRAEANTPPLGMSELPPNLSHLADVAMEEGGECDGFADSSLALDAMLPASERAGGGALASSSAEASGIAFSPLGSANKVPLLASGARVPPASARLGITAEAGASGGMRGGYQWGSGAGAPLIGEGGGRVSPGDGLGVRKVGLKDFALLKVVGKGSFGKVMQIRKKDSGRIYAMKVLHKGNIIRRKQVRGVAGTCCVLCVFVQLSPSFIYCFSCNRWSTLEQSATCLAALCTLSLLALTTRFRPRTSCTLCSTTVRVENYFFTWGARAAFPRTAHAFTVLR